MFNKIMEPCLMKSYIFLNLNINKVSIANTVLFFIKNVIDFFSFFFPSFYMWKTKIL